MLFNVSDDFDEMTKDLSRFQDKLLLVKKNALIRAGQEARNMAMDKAPLKTGDLRRSIVMSPAIPVDYVTIGTNKVYARIQDVGGTIKAVNGRYLTIPLNGVRGSIRNHAGGFFMKSRAGNLLYVQKRGQGIKPLFVLKEQVKIQGTRYLTDTYNKYSSKRFMEILSQELNAVLK